MTEAQVIQAAQTTQETKEATMTLVPPQPADLLSSFLSAIDKHIEQKIAAALEKHLDAVRDVAREVADTLIEEAMDTHAHTYDHDEYERMVNDMDDKINEALDDYDFEEKVKDVLRNI